MGNLIGELRYALRQFWVARVFTITAVLTLALGIGGTTAIFTLIHAVMLRSLPVSDPSRLYRIGDGDSCCVQGGPQDRWGMFSFPLFERLKAELPEFEEIAAFQAGGPRLSVRRQGTESTSRPLRSEYVTGNYFSTLGVNAFGGRVFTAADDAPAAPPVVVLSHHVWQGTYGGDPSLVGATLVIEGHPFTVVGVTAPGFFGETLRGDPPDLWIPLQQEPLINGDTSILRQPVSAWLRVIGRLRRARRPTALAPRLTGILRQWMQHDSGYPSNWMPDIIQGLPRQVIAVVPAGAGVGIMKEQYGRSLQILLGVCGLVLLHRLRQRRQPAARARRRAARSDRAAAGDRRVAAADRDAGARREHPPGRRRRHRRARRRDRHRAAAAGAGVRRRELRADQYLSGTDGPGVRVRARARDRHRVRRRAGVVRDAHRSDRRAARRRPQHGRSLLGHAQGAARRAGDGGGRAGRRLDDAGAQPRKSGDIRTSATRVQGRVLVALNRPPATYTAEKLAALNRDLEERLTRLPGVRGAGLALYNPLTDNWGELVLVAGHPAPKPGEQAGASWDRVSANYLQNSGREARRAGATSARPTTSRPSTWRS